MPKPDYFEHSIPEIKIAGTQAYEVVTFTESGEVNRLGWVIRMESGEFQEVSWVAIAVISRTGDSFLGTFKSADSAIRQLWDNEKLLEVGRGQAR